MTMHHAERMRFRKSVGDLRRKLGRAARIQWTTRHQTRKHFARNELGGQKQLLAVIANFVQRGNVWMRQPGDDGHFAQKMRATVRITGNVAGDNGNGDRSTVTGVAGSIYFAKAGGSNTVEDAVLPDRVGHRKRSIIGRAGQVGRVGLFPMSHV
jgi:hypothetical protein